MATRIGHGAHFSPMSWLVFHPFTRLEFAEAHRLLRFVDSTEPYRSSPLALPPELARRSINMWRVRHHEWCHYFQYACCGGFSLFCHRLVRIRLAAALEVLNAYYAKHGTLKSMTRLVAENLYGVTDGRRPDKFLLDDRAWA